MGRLDGSKTAQKPETMAGSFKFPHWDGDVVHVLWVVAVCGKQVGLVHVPSEGEKESECNSLAAHRPAGMSYVPFHSTPDVLQVWLLAVQ